MNKSKKKLAIIILILVISVAGVGIYYLGKSSGKDKVKKPNQHRLNAEMKAKETELEQIKKKLETETDPTKKQELETKKTNLEQQLTQLKNQNKPSSPPVPSSNSNNPNNNGNNPPQQNPPIQNKTSRQWTVKYNTEVGGKHEYINVNNFKERILIDQKNKIFSFGTSLNTLTIKDNHYTVSFQEEDATEKRINSFYFAENNDKFQLSSSKPSPQPDNNGSENKIELEVRWSGTLKSGYVMLGNQGQGIDSNGREKMLFYIQETHPIFKGKKIVYEPFESPFTTLNPIPKFKLSFVEKNVSSKGQDNEYIFDKDNNNFTLTPLGNWPDESTQTPPTPPRNLSDDKEEITITYGSHPNKFYYIFETEEGENIFIEKACRNKEGVQIKETELSLGKKYLFRRLKIQNRETHFYENDWFELEEKNGTSSNSSSGGEDRSGDKIIENLILDDHVNEASSLLPDSIINQGSDYYIFKRQWPRKYFYINENHPTFANYHYPTTLLNTYRLEFLEEEAKNMDKTVFEPGDHVRYIGSV